MQALAQPNSTPLPQKPTCFVWYAGDACDESLQQYHDLMLERQQRVWENTVAAPLRRQIADQQKQLADQQIQIKSLQLAIASQSTATLHSRARSRAAIELLGAMIGIGLALLVALAVFRKLARNSGFVPQNIGYSS